MMNANDPASAEFPDFPVFFPADSSERPLRELSIPAHVIHRATTDANAAMRRLQRSGVPSATIAIQRRATLVTSLSESLCPHFGWRSTSTGTASFGRPGFFHCITGVTLVIARARHLGDVHVRPRLTGGIDRQTHRLYGDPVDDAQLAVLCHPRIWMLLYDYTEDGDITVEIAHPLAIDHRDEVVDWTHRIVVPTSGDLRATGATTCTTPNTRCPHRWSPPQPPLWRTAGNQGESGDA